MSAVYIVDAKRTPIGRFGGGLRNLSAVDLAVAVSRSILPGELAAHVDQMILGQVLQAGCGMNVARQVALKVGIPQPVPSFVVNMVCGSGLKSVGLAAQSIASGEADLVVAGGTESMSQAPHYHRDARWGTKLGNASLDDAIFADGLTDPLLKIGMGETAERLADRYSISRIEQDAFAAQSQARAAAARDAFRRETVAITTKQGIITDDEHPRADTTVEKLSALKPEFRANGTVTAGNASGINDGAALVLLASEAAVKRHQLVPRARWVASAAQGCDPAEMGIGPVGAVRKLLAQTGKTLSDVNAVEINEAFAVQALACARELEVPMEKLNPRGGAIALGHPVGASGARVLVTLIHHLEDTQQHRGIATLCIGGGMGIAAMIERV